MKYILTLSLSLLLTSCGNSSNDETAKTENQTTSKATTLPSHLTYKILKEVPNDALSKCNIDIELNHKISEKELTDLANKIRSTRTQYNNLWVFYTLHNMKVGSGAWATTHFTPGIEVKILGATSDQEATSNLSADKIDGKIIAKWHEEQITSASYSFYEKDKKFFIKTTFKNGQTMIEEVKRKKLNQYSERLTAVNNTNGEYFEINQNGELEFFNKDDKKFATGQTTK